MSEGKHTDPVSTFVRSDRPYILLAGAQVTCIFYHAQDADFELLTFILR